MHQLSQWRKQNIARAAFENAARNYGLRIETPEFFRNGSAMGIDTPHRMLLHYKNGQETLIALDDIHSCSFFKHQKKDGADGDSGSPILSMGVQIVLKKSQTHKLNLPIYEGKEGFTFGDEERISERWIKIIRSHLFTEQVALKA